jgi:phage shock protein B
LLTKTALVLLTLLGALVVMLPLGAAVGAVALFAAEFPDGVVLLLGPVLIGLGLLVSVFIAVLLWKVVAAGTKSEPNRLSSEDVRTIQEMHRGMARLEDRVEALEEILMRSEGASDRRGHRRANREA